jgi:hypothetical protein
MNKKFIDQQEVQRQGMLKGEFLNKELMMKLAQLKSNWMPKIQILF